MSLPHAVSALCRSWLAGDWARGPLTMRLMLVLHLVHLLVAPPVRGQATSSSRPGSRLGAGNQLRQRCQCRWQGAQRDADHDLPVLWEDTDEGLQWYLRLSAFISHTQRSVDHKAPGVDSPGGTAPHAPGQQDVWPDQSRGRVILEQTWSQRWGVCVSHVCDSRTCRRVTLNVACVGPCSWYRHHKCPRKFGGYCVTTPDYQGCKTKAPKSGPNSKFHIVDKKESQEHQAEVGELPAELGVDYTEDVVGLTNSPVLLQTTGPHHPDRGVLTGGENGPTPKAGLEAQDTRAGQATTPMLTSASRQTSMRQSDAVVSGIRYVWVVSCIVVPTLVFCVGYAIAMHFRRKRLLRGMLPPARPCPEGASDPFLAAAPPYSVEDLFACPQGSGLPGLDCSPPSYEAACRERTMSACSAYVHEEPHLSCPASLAPLAEPPPYDDHPAPRGHLRLPSYDSAICLHTSI